MFETFDDTLGMIWLYAAAGFCLAVIYGILRFFRLALPKMKRTAAVCDFLFAVTAGFVLFALSVGYGTGFFRLYYVVAAAFGFALNMVTIGAPVPLLARLMRRFLTFAAGKVAKPAKIVCEKITDISARLLKYMAETAKKCEKHLIIRRKMVYNVKDNKIDEVYPKGGENSNAIQAKVRKIV